MEGRQHAPPDSGSRTLTQNGAPPGEGNVAGPSQPGVGVLKLRGGPSRRQKVVWSEGTIDNEGLGKKKSKSGSNCKDVKISLTCSLLYIP
jgi:protein phosphatase 1 regulatory subunit 11